MRFRCVTWISRASLGASLRVVVQPEPQWVLGSAPGPAAAGGGSQALSLRTEEQIPPRGSHRGTDGPGAAAGAGRGAGGCGRRGFGEMLRAGVLP